LLNTQSDLTINDFTLAKIYQEKLSDRLNIFDPTILKVEENSIIDKIDYAFTQQKDAYFPSGYSYLKQGKLGADILNVWKVSIISENLNLEKNKPVLQIYIEPISEDIFFGVKEKMEVESLIKSNFDNFLNNSTKKAPEYLKLAYPEDNTKLENILLKEIKWKDTENKILSLNESFNIGSININLGNCSKMRTLNFSYTPSSNQYLFVQPQEFLDNLCIKQFIEANGYFIGTCVDCTFYPANKAYALRPDYTPEVLPIDFAPGFQRISKAAYDNFRELYKAAKEDGVDLLLASGYRSYADQVSTFNYWVSTELLKGYSQYQAEINANTYSARPGFSEHQLGTALDLNGAGCDSFSNCTGNQQAWDWLANNAYKFGFVISYPAGKENETGYIYEPWHYRWIGKELAAEYKKVEADTYLQKWLFELGKY